MHRLFPAPQCVRMSSVLFERTAAFVGQTNGRAEKRGCGNCPDWQHTHEKHPSAFDANAGVVKKWSKLENCLHWSSRRSELNTHFLAESHSVPCSSHITCSVVFEKTCAVASNGTPYSLSFGTVPQRVTLAHSSAVTVQFGSNFVHDSVHTRVNSSNDIRG